MTTTPPTATASRAAPAQAAQRAGIARVRRNFWLLVAATTIAVGVLSQALKGPNNPTTAAIVAVSGLAAVASLTLAGRILVVTTTGRCRRRRTAGRRWVRR